MSSALRFVARHRRAVAVLALAAASVSACHRNQTTAGTDESSNEPATIEFANESLTQADVFVASRGSGARRIGTVFAGRTETLTIPSELSNRGSVAIVARLLASNRAPSTGTIAIGPGAHLSVRLPMDERSLFVLPAQ
jgi:hypothetical protein